MSCWMEEAKLAIMNFCNCCEQENCIACHVCAKGENEECGGAWGIFGNCAEGLRCLHQFDINSSEAEFVSVGKCIKSNQTSSLLKKLQHDSTLISLDDPTTGIDIVCE